MVPGQPRQKKKKKIIRSDLSREKLGVVVHAYRPSDGENHQNRRIAVRMAWVKSKTLSPKQPEQSGVEAGSCGKTPA
jgi:hypothetical protein